MDTKLDGSSEEEAFCPLFMEGLPQDFSTNPTLAAIASLLQDDDKEDDRDTAQEKKAEIAARPGGGKLSRAKGRSNRQKNSPYASAKTKAKKPTSLGEAQLFLKMWKL
jgi:hypothetical protein